MAQARRYKKNKTPAWVWLIIGTLLGFFLSHVDLLETYRFIENSIAKNQHAKKERGNPRPLQQEETKFDFYNILSEKSSELNDRARLEASKPSKTALEPASSTQKKQNASTSIDRERQTRLPPLQKSQITQLPPLNKQKKQEKPLEKNLSSEEVQPAQLEEPKKKLVQEKPLANLLPPSQSNLMKIAEKEKTKKPEKLTIQIAALKSYTEADRYKAQLLLLGFQGIRIQKVTKNNVIWFRITVGNYNNRQDAEVARKKLQQNHINGLVIPK